MANHHVFAARLNQALDEMPGYSRPPPKGRGRQQHVARMFGVSQKGARKWLEGEALPRTSRIAAIARRCQISGEWLLTGQGPMRPAAPEPRESLRAADRAATYRVSESRIKGLSDRIRQSAIEGALTDDDLSEIESLVLWLIGWRRRQR